MKKAYYIAWSLFGVVALTGCIPPKTNVLTPEAMKKQQQQQNQQYQQQQNSQGYPSTTGIYESQNIKTVVSPTPIAVEGENGFNQIAQQPQSTSFVPSMAYINDRIYEYGRKLERWKKLDEQSLTMNLPQEDADDMVQCFRDLQRVLGGYSRFREELLQQNDLRNSDGVSGERFLELQKRDISFIESSCGRTVGGGAEDKGAGWHEREETADLSQLETLIDRYAENGEYEEVVQVWLQIPETQVDRVDLKTRISYGNALMYLHQEEKAAQVYQQIVDEMSSSKKQSTDLISLRKVLADLYTAAGNYQQAEKQYGQISEDYQNLNSIEEWAKLQLFILERSEQGSPELSEYSSLLRNYLGMIPDQDGFKVVWQADDFLANYPYTAVSSNVDMIKNDALERANGWFDDFLAGIDALAAEKKYEECLEILETIPDDIIDDEKKRILKDKTDALILEEAVNRETEKLSKMQELQRQWNSGILMMEDGDYENAIGVFIGLLDSEYATKASEKIEEVSLMAAKADRRKAANIFSRFTKTGDVESKKALLIECRKILRGILVKYPDVDIADKVVGNIKRVEKEMNMIDPNMLPAIMQAEAEDKEVKAEFDSMAPPAQDPFDLVPSVQEQNLVQ